MAGLLPGSLIIESLSAVDEAQKTSGDGEYKQYAGRKSARQTRRDGWHHGQ